MKIREVAFALVDFSVYRKSVNAKVKWIIVAKASLLKLGVMKF